MHRLFFLFVVAAFVFAGTQPGLARDLWRATTSGSFVTLNYGPLDTQAQPVFLLSCLNGVGIAVLSVYMDFDEKRAGSPLNIEISAGGHSAPVGGDTALNDATDTIYGDFGDIAVSPIVKVLREKGPVTITSGDAKATLSDAGRAEAVEEFTRDCKLN